MNRPIHTKLEPDTEANHKAELERKGKERLQVWDKIQGMWKDKKPDPIKELKKVREEWERDPQ